MRLLSRECRFDASEALLLSTGSGPGSRSNFDELPEGVGEDMLGKGLGDV